MKRFTALASLALVMFLFVGCKAVNTPLPTGAINAADAGLNANLQAAHAALVQYEADVASGQHVPDATEKAIVNKVILSLNTADSLYQSYHAALKLNPGAGEPAELVSALAAVTTNLQALQALIQGVK